MQELGLMPFIDRNHAARLLVERLAAYRGERVVVLGIPRGAVPMAALIADALDADLDVVLVRKLGAPFQPELALGAIDEAGQVTLNDFAGRLELDQAYLDETARSQLSLLRERRQRYTGRAPVTVTGRTVIVVDDGLATGATMIAALNSLRAQQPGRLICAVPVAPPDTLAKVMRHADEVVCLEAPIGFQAVGQFYRSFPQVEDEEVIALLQSRVLPPEHE